MILRTEDGTWRCAKTKGVIEVRRKDGSILKIANDVYELRRPDGQRITLRDQKAQSFASDLGKKYDRGIPIKKIFAQLWRIYA